MALGTAATIALTAGALGGGALLGSKKKIGGTDPSLEKTSTLNPEQEAVSKALGPFISERIGKGLPAYEGDMVAGLSELEGLGLGQAKQFVTSGPGSVATQSLGAFGEAMEGMSPEEIESFYNQHYQPIRNRIFERDVMPAVRESFVGPGAFRSSGMQDAIARSAGQFAEEGARDIGDYILAERGQNKQLLSLAPAFAALEEESPLRRAEAGLAFGQLPRALEQAELEAKFSEFQRTMPELSPILDQAMQYLGIPTQASYFNPGSPNQILELLKGVGGVAGAAYGARAGRVA